MPIVSAVLYTDERQRAGLLEALQADPQVEIGEIAHDRVPIVVDTPDRAADKAAWKTLERHPEVLRIELVFAEFSDVHQEVS